MKYKDIIKNKPKDATHWSNGYYYSYNGFGLWFKFENGGYFGCLYEIIESNMLSLAK